MKRTWVYPSDGSEAYEVTRGEYRNESMASVMGDIAPFMSPDGVMIEGRKQWREHLKRTDSIEMGHSDVKYAQQEWNKKKEAHRDRLRGQLATVQEFDRPGAPIAPVKMSNLNVEMAKLMSDIIFVTVETTGLY